MDPYFDTPEGKAAAANLIVKDQDGPFPPPPPPPPAKAEAPKPPLTEKPEAQKLIRLKTEKGEFDVPEEIAKGYLRQADYTKKTQDLSLQRSKVSGRMKRLDDFEKDPKNFIASHFPELLKTD